MSKKKIKKKYVPLDKITERKIKSLALSTYFKKNPEVFPKFEEEFNKLTTEVERRDLAEKTLKGMYQYYDSII